MLPAYASCHMILYVLFFSFFQTPCIFYTTLVFQPDGFQRAIDLSFIKRSLTVSPGERGLMPQGKKGFRLAILSSLWRKGNSCNAPYLHSKCPHFSFP